MFRFGDAGGEMYATAGNALLHWSSASTPSGNAGTLSIAASSGRTSGSCLRININGTSQTYLLTKTLDAQATMGVAFALHIGAIPAAALILLKFMDGGTTQVDFRVNTDGTVSITRNGTTLAISTFVIIPNIWNHFELKVTFHPSAGTVYLAINGVQSFSLTSQNTRNTANSSANQVGIGSMTQSVFAGNINLNFDDFIVYDGQTTDANGLTDITGPIGDVGLAWLLPTGAGTTTNFTPDSGSNYARVNEATPDGDTSYVESSTVTNIDTYAMADLPASASAVKSLALMHYAKKTDVGSRGMKAELRTASTNYAHATEINLSQSYLYYHSNWGFNPNTSVAWTVSDVNAIEAGQQVSS